MDLRVKLRLTYGPNDWTTILCRDRDEAIEKLRTTRVIRVVVRAVVETLGGESEEMSLE